MSEVFSIRPDEWQVRLGDRVLPTIWNSRGAALAGLAVEARRIEARELKCKLAADNDEAYCRECGSANLACGELYASGREWTCIECGHVFQRNERSPI